MEMTVLRQPSFPSWKRSTKGKAHFLKVLKIVPESVLVGVWRASLSLVTSSALPSYSLPSYLTLLTPWLPFQLIVSVLFTLAPGNFTPHSPYSSLCSCSFLNPSCMMPELWPSGETNHLFNIKCPQRLPVEVCWLDLVRTQLQCFRNDHKFIVS